MRIIIFLMLVIFWGLNTAIAYAVPGTLLVEISGIEAGKGDIRVAVFDESSRDQFPDGAFLVGVIIPATEQSMTIKIPGLQHGRYAVAVFQDIDTNNKLDRNLFSIPKEPYGFSGNWTWGSASYDDAAFHTKDVDFSITIKLN